MVKRLTLLFLLITGFKAGAQQLGVTEYDALTYNLYLKGLWKQLVVEGRQAEKEGQGFYYLYTRMGVAYNQTGKTRKAQQYFQKAYNYNHYDSWVNFQLYSSLFANEKYDEAFLLSKKFDDSCIAWYGIRRPAAVNMVHAYGGLKLASDHTYFKDMKLAGAGFNHRVGKGISLYHEFSYLEQQFSILDTKQGQYFVQGNIPLTNTFTLQPAIAVIALNIDITDTAIADINRSFIVASVNAVKSYPLFDISCAVSFSNIRGAQDNVQQFQLTPGITVYPLYNSKLKITYRYIGQETTDTAYYYAQYGEVAVKPLRCLTVKASYYNASRYNRLAKNMNEMNGYLVNNSEDLLKDRYAAQVEVQVCPHLVCYIYYNLEHREGRYFSFDTQPPSPDDIKYTNHTFVTGIKIII